MAKKGNALKRLGDTGVFGATPRVYGEFVLLTNEAEAAIETDGFLDEDADRFTPGKGDILRVVADIDGSVTGLMYVVTRSGTDITLTTFKGMG